MEGDEWGRSGGCFGKEEKQNYSLKHDSPEGLCTVMDSKKGITTHKEGSAMGMEICIHMSAGTRAVCAHRYMPRGWSSGKSKEL